MAPRLKILVASGSKKGTQIYFSLKSQQMNPLQVPQQGPYGERYPLTGHFAYLTKTPSYGFPSKGALPQDPLMESLAERCPTTRALLHSSIKVPGIRAPLPHTRFPSVRHWDRWEDIIKMDFIEWGWSDGGLTAVLMPLRSILIL
jgi:hypothetical protein